MMNYDLSPLLRQWVAFDKLAGTLQNANDSQAFPPCNIEKSDDNHYRITLALAGFRQQDLDIGQEGTLLRIIGRAQLTHVQQGLLVMSPLITWWGQQVAGLLVILPSDQESWR